MKNLNGNLLCAIDVETTGLNPLLNSILDIAIIPLNNLCNVDKTKKIFNIQMKPKIGGIVDFEALKAQYKEESHNASDPGNQHTHKVCIEEQYLSRCMIEGIDPDSGAELFMRWFDKLGLGMKKRIVPLAHNWPFDQSFIKDWLGNLTYELCFDPRMRDTLTISNYENDVADFRNVPFPYPKNRLKELVSRHHLPPMVSHRALDDAYQTSLVYKKMMQTSFISTRLVTPDDITYKCAECGDTQISKIINNKPYCASHFPADIPRS